MKQFDLMFPSKPYTVRCSTTPEGEPNACWLIWFALTTSRRSPVPNMDHVPGRSILSHMTQSHVVFLFPMSPAQRMETKMFLSSRGDTHPPLHHPTITPPSPLHPSTHSGTRQWDMQMSTSSQVVTSAVPPNTEPAFFLPHVSAAGPNSRDPVPEAHPGALWDCL